MQPHAARGQGPLSGSVHRLHKPLPGWRRDSKPSVTAGPPPPRRLRRTLPPPQSAQLRTAPSPQRAWPSLTQAFLTPSVQGLCPRPSSPSLPGILSPRPWPTGQATPSAGPPATARQTVPRNHSRCTGQPHTARPPTLRTRRPRPHAHARRTLHGCPRYARTTSSHARASHALTHAPPHPLTSCHARASHAPMHAPPTSPRTRVTPSRTRQPHPPTHAPAVPPRTRARTSAHSCWPLRRALGRGRAPWVIRDL